MDTPTIDRLRPADTWSARVPLAPLKSRWLAAALLVVVALTGVVMWGLLTVRAVDETAAGFARSDLPGELTADLRPGTWNVFVEGGADVERVTVSHPDGRPVEVVRRDGVGPAYDRQGSVATRVASFVLPRGGEWPGMTIRVDGTAEDPGATFAVGADDELTFAGEQRWGILALLVVNLGVAVLIVVVPIVRWRRHRDPSVAGAVPGTVPVSSEEVRP